MRDGSRHLDCKENQHFSNNTLRSINNLQMQSLHLNVFFFHLLGMLKYTDLHIRKPLLPPLNKKAAEEECRIRTPNLHCFHAGDDRVNEQPGLATIHTLWLR